MSNRTYDAAQLAENIDARELQSRINSIETRMRTTIENAELSGHDVATWQVEELADDKRSLAAHMAALEMRRARDDEAKDKAATIAEALMYGATETRSNGFELHVSRRTLEEHAVAIREGRIHAVEERARATAATYGAPVLFDGGGVTAPPTLRAVSGIVRLDAVGSSLQVPRVSPAAAGGVLEGADHSELTAAVQTATMLRYGRWSEVSGLVDAVGQLGALTQGQLASIALDLNSADAAAITTAAGAAQAFNADIEGNVRSALLTVSQATGYGPGQLTVIGSGPDLALLTGTSPTSGADGESAVERWQGARLFATGGVTAGTIVVFAGAAFRAAQVGPATSTTIDPKSGARVFGSWVHAAAALMAAGGAAVAVDVVTP